MIEGDRIVLNEIYLSLQGESTLAGLPCIFVRLTACNLRCSWCDTAYAFHEGNRVTVDEAHGEVMKLADAFPTRRFPVGGPDTVRLPLIEFTGGEPLLQPAILPWMRRLCDAGFTVMVETNGAIDISTLDARIRRIVDLKCPASGESHRNRIENLAVLGPLDELKFVIASLQDYEWARAQVRERQLPCPVLFSWASPLAPGQAHPSLKPFPPDHTPISRRELAERIAADALPVRFQVQLHKVLWPVDQRGV